MAIDFSRERKHVRQLPLIPMIDVVFMLIVFFMLTTNFMKVESMELMLPGSGSKAMNNAQISRIVIDRNGDVFFGHRPVNVDELNRTLQALFEKDPERRVVVLTSGEVSMQKLVSVIDTIYIAGGKSLFVKEWDND